MKATAEVRRDAATEPYQLAARKFAKQIGTIPGWHKQKALKDDIAKFLNSKIERSETLRAVYLSGPRKGVTGKWVARAANWQGIQTALKRGK